MFTCWSHLPLLQDLKYIYGRYINPSSEEEKIMYVKLGPDGFDFIHTACVSLQPFLPPPAIFDPGNLSFSLESF